VNTTRSRSSVVRFWLAAAVGWAVIATGVLGVLRDADATRPGDLTRWFLGLLLLHDLVLVPIALSSAWLLSHVAPLSLRTPLLLGAAATALVVALAWPLVRGYGEREANPTLLPLPYGRNLAVALALVWSAVVVTSMLGWRHRSRRTSGRTEDAK
jgi:hypothetical protein